MLDADLLKQSLNHPRSSVPVFYIHSFEQPFCHNQCCPCQRTRQQATGLFVHIIEGKLELVYAANFFER